MWRKRDADQSQLRLAVGLISWEVRLSEMAGIHCTAQKPRRNTFSFGGHNDEITNCHRGWICSRVQKQVGAERIRNWTPPRRMTRWELRGLPERGRWLAGRGRLARALPG